MGRRRANRRSASRTADGPHQRCAAPRSTSHNPAAATMVSTRLPSSNGCSNRSRTMTPAGTSGGINFPTMTGSWTGAAPPDYRCSGSRISLTFAGRRSHAAILGVSAERIAHRSAQVLVQLRWVRMEPAAEIPDAGPLVRFLVELGGALVLSGEAVDEVRVILRDRRHAGRRTARRHHRAADRADDSGGNGRRCSYPDQLGGVVQQLSARPGHCGLRAGAGCHPRRHHPDRRAGRSWR